MENVFGKQNKEHHLLETQKIGEYLLGSPRKTKTMDNQDKSAASLGRQVAAWVQDIFCGFYLVKNNKVANNSVTTKAEKNKHRFRIIRIFKYFDVYLAKFENNQFLLNKISDRFLLMTKLFTR